MINYIHSNNQSMHELSGSLSNYKKNTTLSFQEIREQAWEKVVSKNFLCHSREGIVAWYKKPARCHPCESRDPEKITLILIQNKYLVK